jgi:hypothetical protein
MGVLASLPDVEDDVRDEALREFARWGLATRGDLARLPRAGLSRWPSFSRGCSSHSRPRSNAPIGARSS